MLTVFAASCGFKTAKTDGPYKQSACERLNIQLSQWDPENTRTLMACLVGDAEWAQRIEEIPAKNFSQTAQWLGDKAGLSRMAHKFLSLHSDWGYIFHSPKIHQTLSHSNIQSVLQFSKAAGRDWKTHFLKFQNDYQSLLKKIFDLDLTPDEQVRFLHAVGSIFRELPIDPKKNQNWAEGVWRFMLAMEKNPAGAASLALIAPHNTCTRLKYPNQHQVRTVSPLELGVNLFRNPSINPESFVETFQQGYLFWQTVCDGSPKISKNEVRALLNLAINEFDLMKTVAEIPWSQRDILALGSILEINQRAILHSQESIFSILVESKGLKKLFLDLQNSPSRAADLTGNTPSESLPFEVFAELAANPDFGPEKLFSLWIENLDFLTELAEKPEVINEWQAILAQLGRDSTDDFGSSIQSGKFQERMKYLLYLMNLQAIAGLPGQILKRVENFTSSDEENRPALENKISSSASHNGTFHSDRARRLIERCLKDSFSVAEEFNCLKNEGSQAFPPSARWLPYFHADWEVLYLLRSFPMDFLLDQKTATEFWKPMISGLHLPLKNTSSLLDWLSQGHQLKSSDQETLLLLGKKLFTALTQIPATQPILPNSSSPSVKRNLDPAYFKVQPMLKKLDSQYFSQMIYSLIGDPNFLETRRSFYRLSQTRVPIKIRNNSEVPMLSVFNELIANFKVPFLSRSRSLSLALSSASDIKNPDDLVKWMADTEKLLSRSDWWLSAVYRVDEEPRRSILLAKDILETLRAKANPNDLWKVFAWIRDFRLKGQWSQENLAFLMMIHEMGFFESIQDLYTTPPKWLMNGIENSKPESAEALRGISNWIAETLLAIFQGMNDHELYELAMLNQDATNGKFLSWAMIELGELVVNPSFRLSDPGKKWLLSGIHQIGPPPLKSPQTITPLIKFIREHKTEFEKIFRPQVLQLAYELRKWEAYPELVDFLTSTQRVPEWYELVEWFRSPIPQRLWNWSLRLERRSLDPAIPQNPIK